MSLAIETKDLVKKYGELTALYGIDISIPVGECYGLLGPNGAGKTTLIRILSTLLKPTTGLAKIMDIDVARHANDVRRYIGVVPQAMTSDLDLTGYEAMDIYARFFGMPKKERRARIDELLTRVGLLERSKDLIATYSGGMRRRLEIARGLVHKPSILILDEPTIGLDPQSRHVVWELLEQFRAEDNLTILLTTHYMAEAESLCDRVAIIDFGRIVALDTVEGLKNSIPEKDSIELTLSGIDMQKAVEWVKGAKITENCVATGDVLKVYTGNGADTIPALIEGVKALGANISRVMLKEQTLEDVFIHYTGRPIREEEAKKVSFFIGAGLPSKMGR